MADTRGWGPEINVGFNTRDLKKELPLADALVGRAEDLDSPVGRLRRQKGGVRVGGGRGVFSGTLRDIASRDEFVGRTGTIARGLMAGRIGGAAMAFVSVEEGFRAWADLLKGDKHIGDIIGDIVRRLVPGILIDSIPKIFDELGGADSQAARRRTLKTLLDERISDLKRSDIFSGDSEQARTMRKFVSERRQWEGEWRRKMNEDVEYRK